MGMTFGEVHQGAQLIQQASRERPTWGRRVTVLDGEQLYIRSEMRRTWEGPERDGVVCRLPRTGEKGNLVLVRFPATTYQTERDLGVPLRQLWGDADAFEAEEERRRASAEQERENTRARNDAIAAEARVITEKFQAAGFRHIRAREQYGRLHLEMNGEDVHLLLSKLRL